MSTVLCPLYVSSFALLLLWTVGLGVLFLPMLGIYRVLWFRRFRAAGIRSTTRLSGTVIATAEDSGVRCDHCRRLVYSRDRDNVTASRPFALRCGEQLVSIDPGDAPIRGLVQRVEVGDRLTIDAIPASVEVGSGDRLFRESSRSPGMLAVQIIRGAWPPLRRLARISTMVWFACLLLLLFGIH